MNRLRVHVWPVLLTGLVYPTLLTLAYFVWLAGSSQHIQQAAFTIGKTIQFALPLVWFGLILRQPLRWPPFNTRGLLAGIVFGAAIGGTMFALYFGHFRSSGAFAAAGSEILHRLSSIGVTSPATYAAVAVFYSLLHSLLEEYYWRWFVFGTLRKVAPLVAAIVVSSVGFMAHHVVVLGLYFGWANPWTWLFAIATAAGGAFWAWLYNRSGSIYGPWASHLLIDAAIFGIGYDLVRGAA